jgi:transcriptional regulator with XRE-family HTH domain
VPSSIGRAIAQARARKGLSIQALAREAKVDPSLISRLETGKVSDLRLTVASKLCGALGLKLDDLVDGKRRPELPDRGPTMSDLERVRVALTDVVRLVADIERRR